MQYKEVCTFHGVFGAGREHDAAVWRDAAVRVDRMGSGRGICCDG